VTGLYGGATQVFYQIANAFFWPVAIALLGLFALSLFDLGTLVVQWRRKRREPATDLSAVALAIVMDLRAADGRRDVLSTASMSPSLRRFWGRVQARLRAVPSRENLDVWLEETLQQEEIDVAARLDRSRALVRLGPMLGLAGTIIPLGPALQALLTGDVAGMVAHLVIGFGAVVCGLMMSGIAYVITLVRERWSRVELKEMENLCELILRALRKGRNTREVDEEEQYESLSTA
jgi:biopolymer transport protein ExbB/TolQ